MNSSISFHGKVLGCVAIAALGAVSHAQITIGFNPTAFQSDAVETFDGSGFTPGTYSPSSNPPGAPVWGSRATMQFDQGGTSSSSGTPTTGYVYNSTVANSWSLNNQVLPPYAGVHDGTQGFGIQSGSGAPATATLGFTDGTVGKYFGGYFQAGLNQGVGGTVSFSFFLNGKQVADYVDPGTPNTISFGTRQDDQGNDLKDGSGNVIQTADFFTDPLTNAGALQGISFTFGAADTGFDTVIISGTAVAMDSLRFSTKVEAAPEPATFAPLGLGLLFFVKRRRSKA